MKTTRWLKRLLGASALAVTGVSASASAEIDEDVVETAASPERLADEIDSKRGRWPEHGPGIERPASGSSADWLRVGDLVDGLGPIEPGLAAVTVGSALAAAHPLERIAFVCEWATSPSVVRRRALARALGQLFSCVGAVSALEVLVRDPDPIVRSAARQAALLRLGYDPERYAALMQRAAAASAKRG